MQTAERRVCLLTGAGGLLGSDFCQRYSSDYDIAAICRKRQPIVASQDQRYVDPLGGEVFPGAGEIFTITSELTDPGALERVVELTLARFGRVDVLVNAAAFVQRERLTSLAETTDFLDQAFYVNATIPIRLAALLVRDSWREIPTENRTANRNIVNISSGAGLGVVDAPGLSAYSASKVALNFLTCYLAEELRGIGIRVNAIAPTTFPDLIPTSTVSDMIVHMDRSSDSGTIFELA